MDKVNFRQAEFLNDEEKIKIIVRKPPRRYVYRYDNYTVVQYSKTKIEYDTRSYIGVSILNWSKVHMHKFY